MENRFSYVGTLDSKWGRPVNMCSHRGDIFIAMEYGQLIRVTEDAVSNQLYLQEINMAVYKPMPNPI